MKMVSALRAPRRHRRPAAEQVRVRAVEGAAARRFLRERWPALYVQDPQATPYQAPGWVNGWAAALPAAAAPVVLVAHGPAAGPLAALALVREHGRDARARIQPLGSPVAEYIRAVGPGSSHCAVATAFTQYLAAAARGADVAMSDLPADSALAQELAGRSEWRQSTAQCATVALPLNFSALSRSTRRDHTRRERTWTDLSVQGRVGYARTRTSDELSVALSTVRQLHRRRWAGHAALYDLDQVGLLDVLLHCGVGEAFVATLTLDGQAAASAVCLARGDACYSLLPAMDPERAELAPGHALTRLLARDLALHGYRRLDLGRTLSDPGQRQYKASYGALWTTTVTATSNGSVERR